MTHNPLGNTLGPDPSHSEVQICPEVNVSFADGHSRGEVFKHIAQDHQQNQGRWFLDWVSLALCTVYLSRFCGQSGPQGDLK